MESTIDLGLNITEFPARKISAFWEPKNMVELRDIIIDANRRKAPIYPISTGHNWGLGSKLPVADSEIVHLRKLDQILEVNDALCYARIQPGVTQNQLSNYLLLHHPDLILNVTGSDAHSSVLGNIIDRGSGKNGHRARDLREIKVMLATGEEVSSGFGNISGNKNSFYQYGLGPDLTHLFTQSNYGIVTEGVVNLMVKQPFTLYLIQFQNEHMGELATRFSKMVRTGVIGHSLELDSQNDPKVHELFADQRIGDGSWIGWFVIYGSKPIRKAKEHEMRTTLVDVTDQLQLFDSETAPVDLPRPISVRMKRYSGQPDDHSLIATAQSFGVILDENNPDIDLYKRLPGFRCVLPVIPFSDQGMKEIFFIMQYSKTRNMQPAISIINLDDYALEVFVRVYFDREDQGAIDAAGKWAKGLLKELRDRHIYPYRIDIENMMDYISAMEDQSTHWKNEIKKLFDKNGIIAPNRYSF